MPLWIRTRDENPLGIPSSHPSVTIIKTEKHAPSRLSTLFQTDHVPAAAVFHVIFEEVAVEDAAVYQRDGQFLIVFAPVARDEMPASSGYVFIDTGDGTVPVFFAVDGTVDALAAVEPVEGTEDGTEAEKEIGSHG